MEAKNEIVDELKILGDWAYYALPYRHRHDARLGRSTFAPLTNTR